MSSSSPSMPPTSGGSTGKKKGGGFLHRQAKAKKATNNSTDTVTEEDILQKDAISPDDVLKLPKCTESKYRLVYIFKLFAPAALALTGDWHRSFLTSPV